MKNIKYYGLYFFVGALAYWAVYNVILMIAPRNYMMTALICPASILIAWYLLKRKAIHQKFPVALPAWMLLGILLLGPPFISLQNVSPKIGVLVALPGMYVTLLTSPHQFLMMLAFSGPGVFIVSLLLLILAIASVVNRGLSKKDIHPTDSAGD